MFFPLILGAFRRVKPKGTMPLVIACVVLIGAYSYGVVKRNPVWNNEYSLWEDTVKKSPDGPIPNYNFGLILYGMGEIDKAIEYFQAALKIKPSAKVYSDLALAYGSKGQGEEAIRLLQAAIRLDPGYPLAYNNLGVAFMRKGLFLESIELYRTAIRLNPNYADAYINMGYSYERLGKKDEAARFYRMALTINPADERALRSMESLKN
jgi:tetratricopeptide (TPR) repeat protein